MELKNEKTFEMAEFDIEVSPAEYEQLREYALKHIVNDDEVLINYAINKILQENCKVLENSIKTLNKIKKKKTKNKEK